MNKFFINTRLNNLINQKITNIPWNARASINSKITRTILNQTNNPTSDINPRDSITIPVLKYKVFKQHNTNLITYLWFANGPYSSWVINCGYPWTLILKAFPISKLNVNHIVLTYMNVDWLSGLSWKNNRTFHLYQIPSPGFCLG